MTPTDGPPTDQELLRSTNNLRALARTLVHDSATAEDVAQEAWLAALEGRPPRSVPLQWWLRGVVRNISLRFLRTEERRRRREALVARPEAVAPSAESAAHRAETHRRLVDAVLGLPEPYRHAVLLRYFEELTPKEIASQTGERPGTVRMRLQRGVAMLRARLDADQCGDRRAWALALVPLMFGRLRVSTALASGGVAVKTTTKLYVGALLVLLAAGAAAPLLLRRTPAPVDTRRTSPEAAAVPARRLRPAEPNDIAAPSPAAEPTADPSWSSIIVVVANWCGDPVAVARIDATFATVSDVSADGSPTSIAAAETDASGRATLSDLEPLRPLSIVSTADGFAGRITLATSPGAGETQEVRVRLLPACEVEGRVRTAAGQPIANAVVQIGDGRVARAMSSEDGHYVLRGLEWGVADVRAARPGARPTTVTKVRLPVSGDLDIVLPEPTLVTGTVRDAQSGGPVAGATVRLGIGFGVRASGTATTDAAGRYEIQSLPEGVVNQVEVEASGYVTVRRPPARTPLDFPVRPDESAVVDFALEPVTGDSAQPPDAMHEPPTGVVVVRVVDPSGAPIAGARINGRSAVTTGADGRGRLEGTPAGESIRWHVDAAGFGRGDVEATVDEGATIETSVVLERAPLVRGVVRTEDGAPVPAGTLVQVLAFTGRQEPNRRGPEIVATEADAVRRDGSYEARIPWCGRGSFRVTAWAPGRPPSQAGDRELTGGGGPYDVDVVLPAGMTVRGVVVDAADAQPVPAVPVIAYTWRTSGGHAALESSSAATVATTNHLGQFTATGLATSRTPDGREVAQIGFDVPGFEPTWRTVEISEQGHVTIQLVRVRDVSGVVIWEDGTPAASVRVEADPNWCWTVTSKDGRFVLHPRSTPSQIVVTSTNSTQEVNRQVIELTPGQGDLRIVAQRGLHIGGRVVIQGGRGVPDCVVTAVPSGSRSPVYTARTRGDGSFRLTGLGDGLFDLSVDVPTASPYFQDAAQYRGTRRGSVAADTDGLELELTR